MATKGQAPELAKSSAEVTEKYCSCCSQAGKSVEAGKYCVECSSLLCEVCLQYHKMFPSLRSHTIVDKSEADCHQIRGNNLLECARHYGQPLNSFCKGHDVVCCEVCLNMYHRTCTDVDQVIDIAKGIGSSDTLKAAQHNLKKHLKLVQQEVGDRVMNIERLNKQKEDILIELGKSEDKMVRKIKSLAEKSREAVSAKHAEQVETVKSDLKALENVTSVMEKSKEKLENVDRSDSERFVCAKNCERMVIDVKEMVRNLHENWQQTDLSFKNNQSLFNKIIKAKSYGEVVEHPVDSSEYSATLSRKINITLKDDAQGREIIGICIMENDTIVVTDFYNKRLKRLCKEGNIVDFIDLGGSPASLCQTGSDEVATALREERRVQFVVAGKELSLAHSFHTPYKCTGLCYDSGAETLYVSCGDCFVATVNVYNKNGELLKTFEKDETGGALFKTPTQVVFQPLLDILYVADGVLGVIAIDVKGKKLWTSTNAKLIRPWGIDALPNKMLLVSGVDSHNVLQLGTSGKWDGEFLEASEGFKMPSVLYFNKKDFTLLVGGQSDFIREYNVRLKC